MTAEFSTQPGDTEEDGRTMLYKALQETGADLASYEEQELFRAAAGRILSLYPNPNQRRAVQTAAEVLYWFRFGDESAPLPNGLVKIVDDETKTIHVTCDDRVINEEDLWRAGRLIATNAGYNLSQTPIEESHRVTSAIEALVRQTEGYQLVRSFAAAPPDTIAQQPLTPIMRAIRETQILSETRDRFGISAANMFPRFSPAGIALRHALDRLNDETRSHRNSVTTADQDPLEKIRAFFSPHILDALREKAEDEDKAKILHFSVDQSGDFYAYIEDGGEQLHVWRDEYLESYYSTLRPPGAYELDAPIEATFLHNICSKAFQAQRYPDAPQTYEACLASAMEETVTETYDLLSESMHSDATDSELATFYAYIRQTPGGAMCYASQFETAKKAEVYFNRIEVNAKTEQPENKQDTRTIGHITRHNKHHYPQPRLIQLLDATPNLPAEDPRAVLTFDMSQGIPNGKEPFVPGFIIASHNAQRGDWGFVPDAEGDPYAEAAIAIPPEGINALTASYKAIGLTRLAQTLRAAHQLTVAGLVRQLRAHTEYGISPRLLPAQPTETIADFKEFVEGDILITRCLGSALFLTRSLEDVFGPGCATVLIGHLLPMDKNTIINRLHAMVSFVHNNQTYILDSTAGERTRSLLGFMNRHYRVLHQPAHAPRLVRLPQALPPSSPIIIENLDSLRLQRLQHNFEQQLLHIYGYNDTKKLYRYLAFLPNRDPIRQAVKAILRVNEDTEEGSAILQTAHTYIEDVKQASKTELRRAGLSAYEQTHELLDLTQIMLQAALTILQSTSNGQLS